MSANITVPASLFTLLIDSAENGRKLHLQPENVQAQWGKVIDQTVAAAREHLANQLAYEELNKIGATGDAPVAGTQSFL